ncbi:MAG: helix-turn-helix transcriptional regulator [Leptolyngbya sp. SIOISBB]|nr:helix-turn-helix transcriptional regulator [Leptolyngbya sp. SIOISBB]
MNLPLTSRQRDSSRPSLYANRLAATAEKSTAPSSPQTDAEIAESMNLVANHMVLTEQGQVLYVSERLKQTLGSVGLGASESDLSRDVAISREFAFVGQILRASRSHFPKQTWTIHCNIFTKAGNALGVHASWVKPKPAQPAYILITVEDSQQIAQEILRDEGRAWRLTPREQEVWLLSRQGHTYGQMAEQLCITLNTVKKHMRSIHAKRRAVQDS